MNRKDLCSVFGGEGGLKGQHGLYRIVILALNKGEAARVLETTYHAMSFYHTSRLLREWQLFDDTTSIGDVFVAKYGTTHYFPVDPEDVSA